MAKSTRPKTRPTAKSRLRAELVEMTEGLHRAGLVDDAELEMTTMRMLGRDTLPKIADLTPLEIAKVRERVGVSQSVLAGYLNVAVNTISQWERGERRPTGAALKLLQLVRDKGLDAVR